MREWEIGAVENIHGALPYIRFAPILALVGVGVNRIGKVPFTDYLSRHGVTVLVKMSRDTTRVETEIIGYIMSIDARADIDGDGLEDLLVYVDHYYTQGTGGGTNLFILSRDTPDGMLWVQLTEPSHCNK